MQIFTEKFPNFTQEDGAQISNLLKVEDYSSL